MPYRVRLICCARDEGYAEFETLEEAQSFREDYRNNDQDGHERIGIVMEILEEDS